MFSADSYKTKSVKLELLTLTIFLTLLHGSLGHPTGADAGRCDSMIPGHGEYQPTLSNSYNVDVSAESYRCGESLTVTLAGSDRFRGFLCQARTDVEDYSTTIGTLGQLGEDVMMGDNCGAARSVTHTENSDKTLVNFRWFPDEDYGPVKIVCTVVKLSTYWVNNVTSSAITYGGNCSGVPNTPALTSSSLNTNTVVNGAFSIVQTTNVTSSGNVIMSSLSTVSTTGVLGNRSSRPSQMQSALLVWWFLLWIVFYITIV